ncbi:MAG TPA: tRNA lysidine(34) synthetase TilS, partial [Bacteroidia bacterium]|nr:tRNA lysidine(34) synthetase TilS [Bacteroidia bacterium]
SIAHNSDDAIETFFINLLRGTGIAGLHGIASQQGNIIRPLLSFSRKEIEAFAKKNKIKWREDSSNASDKYERNKIRHHLIPLLEKLQPNARKAINLTIENIGEAEAVYRKAIEANIGKLVQLESGKVLISIKELKHLEHPALYLYEILKEYGFNYAQAKEISGASDSQPGKVFLSATHKLTLDRKHLIINTIKEGKADTEYAIEKATKGIKTLSLNISFSTASKKTGFKPPVSSQTACLDYDKLEFPLSIRKWEKGDKFYPLGMDKPKKVSDFLIDNKVSRPDKERVYVLISGNKIAWIIGHRIDNRFKIVSATKKLYICNIELSPSE